MTAPTFEIIGDGRLCDEAIEALAALLLSVVEAESEMGAVDGQTASPQIDPQSASSGSQLAKKKTKNSRLSRRGARA